MTELSAAPDISTAGGLTSLFPVTTGAGAQLYKATGAEIQAAYGGGGGGGASSLGPGYGRTKTTAAAVAAKFSIRGGGGSLVDRIAGVWGVGLSGWLQCPFGSYSQLIIYATDAQLGFYDASTKSVMQFNVGNGRWIIGRITTTGYNSDGQQYSGVYGYSRTNNATWMRVRWDGSNMKFAVSGNGEDWDEWGTEGTGYMVPVGFTINYPGTLHYFELS
jgi:hypothetical protein